MLDDRKIQILYAIINSYIISAEPIGSRTISKEYDFGISPATIRNEMSDLEELGYLNKAHTSSGRVPSDKGYRNYVDFLIQMIDDEKINKPVYEQNISINYDGLKDIESIMHNFVKILSKNTNYTTMYLIANDENTILQHVELIFIDKFSFVLIMVYKSGIVKNTVLKFSKPLDLNKIKLLSVLLEESMVAVDIRTAVNNIHVILERFPEYKDIFDSLIEVLNNSIEDVKTYKIYFEGISNIFHFPEYKDFERLKNFITFIENKDSFVKVLLNNNSKGIDIKIGEENSEIALFDSTLITDTYDLGDSLIGKIALIGPKRMDYKNIIENLLGISESIKCIFNK